MSGMTFTFDGRPITAEPGQSVAAALWAAGIRSWRRTRHRDEPRGLFCGIGVCFDCLVVINGTSGRRACLAEAHDGDVVERA
jgi:predicted molibdopterin-dependent oxidoreductase YjgC